MTAKITFFPVDCGDMTLLRLADNATTTVQVDVNIRAAADDPEDKTRDVAKDLRDRLPIDVQGRPYVDAFLLSHPDKDHCTGLEKHFYLGPIDDYPDDKKKQSDKRVVIREIWSSPIVFRRASKRHVLCDDALAFQREAKRRVNRFKAGHSPKDGERILILGEDENGKTDDLGAILVKRGEQFNTINGIQNSCFSARLLAPLSSTGAEEEELFSKNHSSIILNMSLGASNWLPNCCNFLTAGDAEVAIWERLWGIYRDQADILAYDLLLAPHHCSWHSLSHDSWSKLREKAKVSEPARNALGQANKGALIISSSKPISDDDCDPPCIRAKREYESILDGNVRGLFYCTGETPSSRHPEPLEIEVTASGPKKASARASGAALVTSVVAPRAGCE